MSFISNKYLSSHGLDDFAMVSEFSGYSKASDITIVLRHIATKVTYNLIY